MAWIAPANHPRAPLVWDSPWLLVTVLALIIVIAVVVFKMVR